jgi:Transposase, Mutator family
VLLIDAIVVKIRDGQVANRPIYVAMGINLDGERDVLGLWVGPPGGEGAKFWMSLLTEDASSSSLSKTSTGTDPRRCRHGRGVPTVGIGRKTGYRWGAERGGLPPLRMGEADRASRYLSQLERQRIATLRGRGLGVREVPASLELTG